MAVPVAASKPWARTNDALLLDDKQVGHIRRIRNLAAQLPDDWSGMMGRSSLQEDFGALRFQLAYMAYALGLAHVHRLPAAPAVFRKPFDQLITKMLSPDVWTYWHYVSTGNGQLNKSLGELPPKWNPVETDNIMYSAYVQSMALMYHYLFDAAKYATEGALTMRLQPLFWGADGQHFAYDERKLNEHVYWTMVQKGYLGIACEPNCVFQICNQVPILGFRLHDMIYGGDTAKEVTDGYVRAWSDFGILDSAGHYNVLVQEREHAACSAPAAAVGRLLAWHADACLEPRLRKSQLSAPHRALVEGWPRRHALDHTRDSASRIWQRAIWRPRFRLGRGLRVRSRRCRHVAAPFGLRRPVPQCCLARRRIFLSAARRMV